MDKRLSSLKINDDDILSIIKSMNSNKSHGWDKLSIKMIKMCETLVYPLKLILKASIQKGVFLDYWKKTNVIRIHKKGSKNLQKNYRPISLLPIFDKIYERIIFKELSNDFYQNQLFTKRQSNFLPGDSCISQLLSIVHETDSPFDYDPNINVSGVFLEILKLLTRYDMREFYLN